MKKSIVLIISLLVSVLMMGGCTSSDDKTIIMGTNAEFEPFEYILGNEVVGFDVDISKKIAEALDKELKVENMAFDGLLAALGSGKVDFVAAGMTVTEERKQSVDFSDPYFVSTQVIIKLNDNEGINGGDDLVGKKIGVQIGTTGELLAKEIEGTDVQSFNAGYAAVMDLVNGKVDAVVLDQEPAKKLVAKNEGTIILEEVLAHEEYAIAVPKGEEELLKVINDTLKTMKEDGSYDQLFGQYFKEATAE